MKKLLLILFMCAFALVDAQPSCVPPHIDKVNYPNPGNIQFVEPANPPYVWHIQWDAVTTFNSPSLKEAIGTSFFVIWKNENGTATGYIAMIAGPAKCGTDPQHTIVGCEGQEGYYFRFRKDYNNGCNSEWSSTYQSGKNGRLKKVNN